MARAKAHCCQTTCRKRCLLLADSMKVAHYCRHLPSPLLDPTPLAAVTLLASGRHTEPDVTPVDAAGPSHLCLIFGRLLLPAACIRQLWLCSMVMLVVVLLLLLVVLVGLVLLLVVGLGGRGLGKPGCQSNAGHTLTNIRCGIGTF